MLLHRLLLSFCVDWEGTSNTRDSVSWVIQTLWISSKILRNASYFSVFGYPGKTLSLAFDMLLQIALICRNTSWTLRTSTIVEISSNFNRLQLRLCQNYAGEIRKRDLHRLFGFVFEEKNHLINETFSKCFPPTLKRKAGVFKSLRLEGHFRKAPFLWRISVDGRSNRRNKVFKFQFFSNFGGVVWTRPHNCRLHMNLSPSKIDLVTISF